MNIALLLLSLSNCCILVEQPLRSVYAGIYIYIDGAMSIWFVHHWRLVELGVFLLHVSLYTMLEFFVNKIVNLYLQQVAVPTQLIHVYTIWLVVSG